MPWKNQKNPIHFKKLKNSNGYLKNGKQSKQQQLLDNEIVKNVQKSQKIQEMGK